MKKTLLALILILSISLVGCKKQDTFDSFSENTLSSFSDFENIDDQAYFVYFYSTECDDCSEYEADMIQFFQNNDEIPFYIYETSDAPQELLGVIASEGPTMGVYFQGELIEIYRGTDYLEIFLNRYGAIDFTDYKDFVGHNEYSYNELEFKDHKRYIAYYYSDECGLCVGIKDELLAFFKDFTGMPFYFIDVAEAEGHTNVQGLTGTPTLLIFNEGGIQEAYIGPGNVLDFIEKYEEIDYDDFSYQHINSYEVALNIEQDAYLIYYYLENCPYCMAAKEQVLNWALSRGMSEVYFMNGATVEDADQIPTELLVLNSGTPIMVVMTNGKFADEYYSGLKEVLDYIEQLGDGEITTTHYRP